LYVRNSTEAYINIYVHLNSFCLEFQTLLYINRPQNMFLGPAQSHTLLRYVQQCTCICTAMYMYLYARVLPELRRMLGHSQVKLVNICLDMIAHSTLHCPSSKMTARFFVMSSVDASAEGQLI